MKSEVRGQRSEVRGQRIFLCLLSSAFCFLFVCSHAGAEEWKVLKGEHFIIHYLEDKEFANEVLRHAERYYNKIASDLGYARYDKFWQWENRVKIYIYRTQEEFRKGAAIPNKWATGLARYKEKEIISYRWNEGFLESLLPHEMTHLIFRDFVGFNKNIPLWLDEGVAQWEEESKRSEAIGIVKDMIRKRDYIPILRLMQMDVRGELDGSVAKRFYVQAVSMVNYLMERYGGLKLTLFYRQLRDGKNIDEALSFVYTGAIHNQQELEKGWLEYYGGGME